VRLNGAGPAEHPFVELGQHLLITKYRCITLNGAVFAHLGRILAARPAGRKSTRSGGRDGHACLPAPLVAGRPVHSPAGSCPLAWHAKGVPVESQGPAAGAGLRQRKRSTMNTSDARHDPEHERQAYAAAVEHDPRDPLREALDYHPDGDSELDALIAYKDALEERLRDVLDDVNGSRCGWSTSRAPETGCTSSSTRTRRGCSRLVTQKRL